MLKTPSPATSRRLQWKPPYLAQKDGIIHAHSDILIPDKLWDVGLLQQPHDLARGVADDWLNSLLFVLLDPVLQQE